MDLVEKWCGCTVCLRVLSFEFEYSAVLMFRVLIDGVFIPH